MKLMLTYAFVSFTTLLSCAQKENPKKNMNSELKASVTGSSSGLKTDTATLGTGCFWCTEAIFQQMDGVLKVTSGYSGGQTANPTYKDICTGTTGHAEVVQVVFDPSKVTFDELLEVFWQTHDPTTLNKQGNDVGTQYRSVVFYHDNEQKEKAAKYKAELDKSGAFDKPIVTEISPYSTFYSAEGYHQDYYNNNGSEPYCYFVIRPKLEKFQKVFKNKLKH
jgi:peptide-methionine (S)-S-oxide reductase